MMITENCCRCMIPLINSLIVDISVWLWLITKLLIYIVKSYQLVQQNTVCCFHLGGSVLLPYYIFIYLMQTNIVYKSIQFCCISLYIHPVCQISNMAVVSNTWICPYCTHIIFFFYCNNQSDTAVSLLFLISMPPVLVMTNGKQL